jgi:hypothetical protein
MAPTRSSVSKSPDSTTRFRYVADAAVFGQHANRFPSSSLGSPLSFFSQRVSSEFLLTHEPLTCSISPYLITTHSRLTLPESLVGVTSARVPSSRSFESLSHRLHAARHSTASKIKKRLQSRLSEHTRLLSTRSSTTLAAPGIGPAPHRHAPASLALWLRPGDSRHRRRRIATTAARAALTGLRTQVVAAACTRSTALATPTVRSH